MGKRIRMTPQPKKTPQSEDAVAATISATTEDVALSAPQMSPRDMGQWMMNAISKSTESMTAMQVTVAHMSGQVGRIEASVETIKAKLDSHSHWIFGIKLFISALLLLLGGAITTIVVPLLKDHVEWKSGPALDSTHVVNRK